MLTATFNPFETDQKRENALKQSLLAKRKLITPPSGMKYIFMVLSLSYLLVKQKTKQNLKQGWLLAF